MNIVVALKVVPDDQDIQVKSDGSLDYSLAKPSVSAYDLNAMEAGVQLKEKIEGCQLTVITVGPCSINDSKLKKNVLARGADKLVIAADDSYTDLDAYATAKALTSLIEAEESFDLILCGDGSADNYAQQVDVQWASLLDLPCVNAVSAIETDGKSVVVKRMLEEVNEELRLPLPAIISVLPDIALPRIPGMKDILAAGKRQSEQMLACELPARSIEIISTISPKRTDRTGEIFDAEDDHAIEKFVSALKAACQ